MSDEKLQELNALIEELEKSVHCYTPMNRDFAFAVPLPKILKLLGVIVTDLSEEMKEIDALRATWHENLKGSGIVD